MGNVLPAILIVIVCFPFAFNAQSLKPLPTEFVDCVTNQRGVPVASNKQQTPLIKSRSGIVAYAEITAQSSTIGQCQNSTTVYVGQGNGSFRRVLRQGVERISDGSIYDGNGVAYMSWSPSGRNLLVVLFQWIWGTDGDGNYKYFLIKAGDNASFRTSFGVNAPFGSSSNTRATRKSASTAGLTTNGFSWRHAHLSTLTRKANPTQLRHASRSQRCFRSTCLLTR